MADGDLARFIDRYTMEYVRTFAHPIERVWRAITDPAEFGQWFIRGSIELKAGGTYRFESNGWTGKVLQIDPPRLIRFSDGGERGYFQYVLAPVAGGTEMRFVQHFWPDGDYREFPGELGGDLPAGPGTPWAPGSVGGWHEMFEELLDHLDGVTPASRLPPTEMNALVQSWARQTEERDYGLTPEQLERIVQGLRQSERWNELNKIYREHIKSNCPPGDRP